MATSTKNKLFIFIIALLLISNIGLAVYFMGMNKQHPKDSRGRGEITRVLKEEIGFNEEQIAQYEQKRMQHRETMRPLFDSMRKAKENFYDQLYLETIDDSLFEKASENIGEKQEMMDRQLFNHFRSVRSLCTAEQQPAFDTMVNNIVQRMIIPRRGNSKTKSTENKTSNNQ